MRRRSPLVRVDCAVQTGPLVEQLYKGQLIVAAERQERHIVEDRLGRLCRIRGNRLRFLQGRRCQPLGFGR